MTDLIEDENILYDINTFTEWISETKLIKVIFYIFKIIFSLNMINIIQIMIFIGPKCLRQIPEISNKQL